AGIRLGAQRGEGAVDECRAETALLQFLIDFGVREDESAVLTRLVDGLADLLIAPTQHETGTFTVMDDDVVFSHTPTLAGGRLPRRGLTAPSEATRRRGSSATRSAATSRSRAGTRLRAASRCPSRSGCSP